MITRAAVVLTTALAAAVVGATPASAQFSGTAGEIVFSRDGVAYTAQADGSGVTRLSDASVKNGFPEATDSMVSYSADGTKVVFIRNTPYFPPFGPPRTWRQVWTADADGSNAVQLTFGQAADHQYPSWSPDGTSIVLINGTGLARMAADGTGLVALGPTSANYPRWSPDGSTIAYYAYNGSTNEIYTIPASGGSPTQLTSGSGTLNMMPDWSPDGTRIAFVSNRVCDPYCYERLWVMNADGSDQHAIHDASPGYDRTPVWSPDGTRILFGGYDPDGTRTFTVAPDGSDLVKLPLGTAAGHDESVSGWRPLPAPADSDGPTITITSPADATTLLVGATATAQWSCADATAVQSCTATLDGAPVSVGDPLDTSTTGSRVLSVSASDVLGNTSSASATVTVVAPPGGAATQVSGGDTVSTGSTASPAVPVQTSLTVPAGTSGLLTVTLQDTTTGNPSGFSLFGKEVVLEGPTATAAAPYTVTFTVDGSALGGVAPSDVQVFRNGSLVTGCTSPTAATPDPCLVSRGFAPDGSGDAAVTVRTSHFSTWSLGRPAYGALTGPYQPVDAAPTVNSAKAGSAIPVKFKLGGDFGLDVLADGYPRTTATSCAGAPTDEVEQTVSASGAALQYDTASGTYTYTWKTAKAQTGCRDLVLRFRDGRSLRMLFSLR